MVGAGKLVGCFGVDVASAILPLFASVQGHPLSFSTGSIRSSL